MCSLLRVVVELEADLVAVERDRAVDVADGQYDDFERPVHGRTPFKGQSSEFREWAGQVSNLRPWD